MKTLNLIPMALSLLLGSALLTGCNGERSALHDASAAQNVTVAETSAAPAGAVPAPKNDVTGAPDGMSALQMTVYKSPTCSCCKGWSEYMREEGFAVKTVDTDDVDAVKAEHGLTDGSLKSCHTAIIGGYVVEGHVPAADVKRLLAERPDITGLSAPGMPMMSPGMSSREPKDYDVIAFDEAGNTSVWSSY